MHLVRKEHQFVSWLAKTWKKAFSTALLVVLIMIVETGSEDACAVSTMPEGSKCTCNTTEADGQRSYVINCVEADLDSVPGDLPEMPTMRFEGNRISVVKYISHTALTELFLSGNEIRFIEDFSFRDLSNLIHLHLDNNKISGLSSYSFKGLTRLKTLYLKNNRLYELENGTFSGTVLPDIEILILSNCRLVSIALNAFSGATSLKMLDLSTNMLTAPIQFLGHLKIDTLNLSSNRLENLANSPFRQLKQLETLHISNNRITNLTAADFKGLSRLNTLNLNNNSISTVDISALKVSDRLTELDLSTNQLRIVSADCFSWSNLYKLYVYGNPWECGCETQWLHNQNVVIEWNLKSNLRYKDFDTFHLKVTIKTF